MKRVGNAFKGVIGGLIFIVVGVILLWWNEDNNVKNIKTTEEMKASYIDVTSEIIDSSNEGKLIATNGPIIYNSLDTLLLTPIAPLNNKFYSSLSNPLIVPKP